MESQDREFNGAVVGQASRGWGGSKSRVSSRRSGDWEGPEDRLGVTTLALKAQFEMLEGWPAPPVLEECVSRDVNGELLNI
jgi:hypothetical protein